MEQLQTRMTFELTEDSFDLSDPIALSEALELFQFTPKRFLDLSHKLIHSVGRLAGAYAHLKHLDLSFNYLSVLTGLQTLCSLEVLLLSHNCLRTLTSTGPLQFLPVLHTLDLRYNPVAQTPHYRVFTIATNLRLTQLDQAAVSLSDRRVAETQHTENAAVVQALVKNVLFSLTLDSLRHRLDLHAELIRRRQVTHYSEVNVHLLMRLVQPPVAAEEWAAETVLNAPEQWTRSWLFTQKQKLQTVLEECSLKATQCLRLLDTPESRPNRRYQLYDERVSYKSLVRFSVRQLKTQLKLKVFYAWKLLVSTSSRPAQLKEVLVRQRMEKLEQYLAHNRRSKVATSKPLLKVGLRTKFYYNTPVENRMRNVQKRVESRVRSSRLLQDVYQRLEAVEAKLSLRAK